MNFGFVVFYPLGTALGFAFYISSTRSLSKHLDHIRLQAYTSLLGTLICAPLLLLSNLADISELQIVIPENVFWVWLLGVAVFGTVSHLFISYALKFASSTTLAPLHYLEILSAVLLGYLVFGDIPDSTALYGMIVIIFSGIYIFLREHFVHKEK